MRLLSSRFAVRFQIQRRVSSISYRSKMSATVATESPILLAAIQMSAGSCKKTNLQTCNRLVSEAASKGATFVSLPECCLYIGGNLFDSDGLEKREVVREGIDDTSVRAYRDMASKNNVWLSVVIPEIIPEDPERGYNLQLVIDPSGNIAAEYRKIHLFDSPYSGLHESKNTKAGEQITVVDCGFARIGLTTCYDLRFPELYSVLRDNGAEIFLVPSAFTYKTGKAHWETLLKARAIENQCYVIAAAQIGKHNEKRTSYGHTMIVDMWGVIKDACPIYQPESGVESESDSACICYATFDRASLDAVRNSMPVQEHKVAGRKIYWRGMSKL